MKAFLMGAVLTTGIAIVASFVLSSLPNNNADEVNTSSAVRVN